MRVYVCDSCDQESAVDRWEEVSPGVVQCPACGDDQERDSLVELGSDDDDGQSDRDAG